MIELNMHDWMNMKCMFKMVGEIALEEETVIIGHYTIECYDRCHTLLSSLLDNDPTTRNIIESVMNTWKQGGILINRKNNPHDVDRGYTVIYATLVWMNNILNSIMPEKDHTDLCCEKAYYEKHKEHILIKEYEDPRIRQIPKDGCYLYKGFKI